MVGGREVNSGYFPIYIKYKNCCYKCNVTLYGRAHWECHDWMITLSLELLAMVLSRLAIEILFIEHISFDVNSMCSTLKY